MINATKLKGTQLKDEKYLFLGAGSAGIGLAGLLCYALVEQGMTLPRTQGRSAHMFDINGLLEIGRTDLVDFHAPMRTRIRRPSDFVAAIRQHQADDDHRRQHRRRRVHPTGRRGDERTQ